jgi:hypothetical protein
LARKPTNTKLKKLCELCGISARMVQYHEEHGIFPKREPGQDYNIEKCVRAYIELIKKEKATPKNKTSEEIQVVELQTKQFKLEREKGLWIERHLVADELVRRIYAIKRDQLAIERRLTKWPEAKEAVKKAHRAMWRAYSRKTGVFKSGK